MKTFTTLILMGILYVVLLVALIETPSPLDLGDLKMKSSLRTQED